MTPQSNLITDAESDQDVEDIPPLPPCDLYSDEPEMESDLHLRQMVLLISCLEWLWRDRTDYFVGGNLTVYYSQKRIKTRDFRGPDFFVVQGIEPRSRKSWTVWEEDGRYPDVIVEILSESTAEVDRTTKKKLYQNTFRTLEYFWFDPETFEFAGFSLNRSGYQPIQPSSQGQLWSEQLQLFLGVHQGKLRFFAPTGELVPTPEEAALSEQQQRLAAERRAEQEAQRAERLAAKLRGLNIDPENV
ncbi:MAG: Uma2 family endonuclease [Myxacorys chilensis ATA2-1-KO14]|jgi:Uma2 family endonuclease|nr:Uma2 family endonuclease [Myxacorys chilensis ATA2-1-KO14]